MPIALINSTIGDPNRASPRMDTLRRYRIIEVQAPS
jgi:hypothetical protein